MYTVLTASHVATEIRILIHVVLFFMSSQNFNPENTVICHNGTVDSKLPSQNCYNLIIVTMSVYLFLPFANGKVPSSGVIRVANIEDLCRTTTVIEFGIQSICCFV